MTSNPTDKTDRRMTRCRHKKFNCVPEKREKGFESQTKGGKRKVAANRAKSSSLSHHIHDLG
jgi:hypothetical protein